jgi:uncharacterized protein YdbL (DUF1318 family)
MKKKLRKIAFTTLLVFAIGSCVTINIYFPAAAVEKAADEIVEEVWGDEEKKPEKDKGGEPQGLLDNHVRFASLGIGPSEAYAQEADINVTTPAIRALKDSIQKRAASIKPYLEKGNAGISNDGLLVIRSTGGLSLKEKASLSRLIDSENKDREALYVEIAKANNFSPDRVPDIKKLFAKSWIKKARKGWWVQGADGKWSQKE